MTSPIAELVKIKSTGAELVAGEGERRLPPILHGKATPEVVREVESFYSTVAEIFDAWVTRRSNKKTQATCRNHVMQFVAWCEIPWPDHAHKLLAVTVNDVKLYRDSLLAARTPPKTIHGRLSAICRFYEYLIRVAAKGKLPINVFNPAHPDFVERENDEAEEPTKALSVEELHELLSLPSGDGIVAYRDRAILTVAAAMGFRISTLVRLEVHDIFEDPKLGPVVRYWQKGDKKEKPQGIHSKAFVAVRQYKEAAQITSGPLFRPRRNRNTEKLSTRPMSERGMSRLLQSYLDRIPGAMEKRRDKDGNEILVSKFTPHSFRATFATILDQQGVQRPKIQKALGHKKPETTDGYCRTEYTGRDSASHQMPL